MGHRHPAALLKLPMLYRLRLSLYGLLSVILAAQQYATAQAMPLADPGKAPIRIFVGGEEKGVPPTLVPSDLSVTLDNVPVQVSSVRPAKDVALLFAVLVDTSNSERVNAKPIQELVVQIFQALSGEKAQGYLIPFDVRAYIPAAPLQAANARAATAVLAFGGGTALFDTIAKTCNTVLSRSAAPGVVRRVILLISDGDDTYSRITSAQAEEAAQHEGVAILTLPTSNHRLQHDDLMQEITSVTGGRQIDVERPFIAQIVAALNNQWVIELPSPTVTDDKLHSLRIKVTHQDVKISAPKRIPVR